VSANDEVRDELNKMTKKQNARLFFPRLDFCTDNGAMIAYAGCQRLLAGQQETLEVIAKPRWPIDELMGI
jgi:N6-L-threonylcarbamoyladenine synthase